MTHPVRLYALDYLRGLSAAGIMVFHFVSFTYGAPDAHSALGRWGLYGVSVFYVISGLTLAHVYKDSLLPSRQSWMLFYSRRVFRIFPLFMLATLVSVFITKKEYSLYDIFMNITGLFGFFDHDNTIALGAWSIGNELCFYLLLPIVIFMARTRVYLFFCVVLFLFLAFAAFAFWGKSTYTHLLDYWSWYIHPLNQAFLFIAGVLIAYYFKPTLSIRRSYILLAIGCAMFILWPGNGDRITLVTGFSRIALSASVIIMAMSFYALPKATGFIHTVLHFLGEASFSVYMLHNIVWVVLTGFAKFSGLVIEGIPKIVLAITITISASYVAYHFFEKRWIRMGQLFNQRYIG